jgi:transcriptional regulator with XRE-family HTH domain
VSATRPNLLAIRLRRTRGWSQTRLAHEFRTVAARLGMSVPDTPAVVKQISRVERGVTSAPEDLYLRLWCETFGVDAAELFGHLDGPPTSNAGSFQVTSHKLIPAFIGCDAAVRAGKSLNATAATGQWMPCDAAKLPDPAGANLYLWPFGVAVVHLREQLTMPSLSNFAVWRRLSYPEARAWADQHLQAATGDPTARTMYTLSAYWLTQPAWSGDQVDTAVRLLAMPSVLLDRDSGTDDGGRNLLEAAEIVERALLRNGGVTRADLVDFGSRGVSIGYASWSGVAYHPVASRRGLSEDELVACELLVQAVWCYTHHILRQVEDGQDPVVPDGFGRRWLRGVRSRLTAPRAIENGQHNAMRDAVITTSGLVRQLDAAMDVLRDAGIGD